MIRALRPCLHFVKNTPAGGSDVGQLLRETI